ncbi:hypothetical protein HN51_022032 [Arachis hypogaea]
MHNSKTPYSENGEPWVGSPKTKFCKHHPKSFSLKKGGKDGDDGTEEVTILTLVEKSMLSTLQRASLVEKSWQKPPERMRVLSNALKTSYGSEPILQNCGISISTSFTQVDGHVLLSTRELIHERISRNVASALASLK